MSELFVSVLTSGLYGSIIILAVLLFRSLARKTPGKWLCLMWLLAFLRLAMPFQIESSFSLQPNMTRLDREVSLTTVQPDIPSVQDQVNAVLDDITLPEDATIYYADAISPSVPVVSATPAEAHIVIDWLAVGGWVWLTGCVCLGGYGLASYLRLKRRVREAVRCADGVWECAGLETAFILGFRKPRIYIPMGTSCGREFILTHERGHIARGDHWWKLLGYLVLAVHWYNPLVWVAYLLLCRDIERACDERVVRHMSLEERKAYSTALLSCSANRAHFAACPVAFGEISVKDRIKNVLNYHRPGIWVILTAAVAVAILAVCFLTTPKSEDPIEQCREALELLKTQESYHVLTESDFEGNEEVLRSRVETEYWKQGNDWVRREYPTSDAAAWWVKEVDGNLYEKLDCATWVSPDIQPYDWREVDELDHGILYPWFERLAWEDMKIALVSREKAENGETITLSFSADDVTCLRTFYFDGNSALYQIVRHSITMGGKPYPGTNKTTILETMEPVDSTLVHDSIEKIMLPKCVDAMVELQNSDELYLSMYTYDGATGQYSTYMRTDRGWLFQHRDPYMDYETVKWLSYDGVLYIYDEVFDGQGKVTVPYQWQKAARAENYVFELPYPFNLDWENIGLHYQNTFTDLLRERIEILYPEQDKIFTFSFYNGTYGSALASFTISDASGKKEAEIYVQYPGDDTVADNLAAQYAEAAAQLGAPPVVRDEAFYEELFTRKTDGAYTTRLIYDLFVAFYRDPEEFARQLYRKYTEDPEQAKEVLLLMSNEVEFSAPARFLQTIAALRNNPNVNQTIVDLLESCYPYE